jgi:predicted AlkP superfamily pyrophosphatase or phosphodiesterase
MLKKTKRVFTLLFLAALALFFIASCANIKPVQAGAVPPHFVPAKHLVFIVLDGWGGAYYPKANMPTVQRMMLQGAWTIKAKSVMPSISWPNWTSLFCGAPPERRTGDAKQEASKNGAVKAIDYFPTIFTAVKNSGQAKKSIFFHEWDELKNICPDTAIEKQRILSDVESAKKVAAYIIKEKPFFTAVGFNEPDNVGHGKKWGSADYYAKLAEMDNLIAIIEQAVKDAGIYDSTVFVLSADHGGIGRGHGANFSKNRNIPMVFYGHGIKEGFAVTSPVRNYDITPTMAAILGMEIPPEWTGRLLHEVFK